jgi:hypothetical protein
MTDVEDLIRQRTDEERSTPTPGLSFRPVHDIAVMIALMARAQERQAIIDALPSGIPVDRSDDWKAGYAAALAEVIRLIVKRSIVV